MCSRHCRRRSDGAGNARRQLHENALDEGESRRAIEVILAAREASWRPCVASTDIEAVCRIFALADSHWHESETTRSRLRQRR